MYLFIDTTVSNICNPEYRKSERVNVVLQPPDFNICPLTPDWDTNMMFISGVFGSLLVSHMIVYFLSLWKVKAYLRIKDRMNAEKKR